MRRLAIIDKNPNARHSQWKAAPDPKKFFHNDQSLISQINNYNPDIIFINKANTFSNILDAIKNRKSIYFWGDFFRPIPEYVIQYASICSAVALTNKDPGLWKQIRQAGQNNIFFVSMGTDTDVFKPIVTNKKFDILFGGNYYGKKFPGSDIRLGLVEYISKLDYKFKVIGDSWPNWLDSTQRQGFIEYNKLINQAKITIGMSHFVDVPYYTSNRLYQMMATTTPHITWQTPGVNQIFKDPSYLEIHSYQELKKVIDYLMFAKRIRIQLGDMQRECILKKHTIYHAWNQIERIIKKILVD